MHSCGKREAAAFSREGKLIRFVGVCWIEKTGGLFATETGAQHNSSSLWLPGSGVGGLGTLCQSCCLQASDCKAWIEACNFRSVSVHVPAVISTPQYGRGHNSSAFEGLPTDLVSNSHPLLWWPDFTETAWNNSGLFGEWRQFVIVNIAETWIYLHSRHLLNCSTTKKNTAVIMYWGLEPTVSLNQCIR